MNNKYELTDEKKNVGAIVLHRIRALRDIPRFGIKAGDLGGWIESGSNLSQNGDAWVSGNAQVFGDAWVSDNARVYGDARVSGDARVYGDAWVSSNADYMVFRNSWSSGRWFTYTSSDKMWAVGGFHGTGEELIRKAYADSEVSGKCYEAIVHAVEVIEAAKAEAEGGNK